MRVVSNDIKSRAVSTVPFTTKICNFANYYPFGMQQTGTAGSYNLSSDYRYGYYGKEKDDEIKTKIYYELYLCSFGSDCYQLFS